MITRDADGSGVATDLPDRALERRTASLQAWMGHNVAGFSPPLTIEKIAGGQSNPTFRLRTGNGSYILRSKPEGPILPGAHAIEREARVMTALRRPSFPVPKVFGFCDDPLVFGSAFYVMEFVDGRILWDARLPDVPHSDRASYFMAMNATIAQLHAVDFAAHGLKGFGAGGDYVGRQIARFARQYQEDDVAGRDPFMDRLIEWLPRHQPVAVEDAIVHGDFRCDNLVFHPNEPRVIAVLDWELSTIGNPVADFAYHLLMYHLPAIEKASLIGVDLSALNIPPESSYIDAYCANSGRGQLPDLGFYLSFNLFRLAAIFHGIKGRLLRGNAKAATANQMAAAFPRVAEEAWKLAQTI